MDPFSIAAALGLMLASTAFKKHGMERIGHQQQQVSSAERMRQGEMEAQKQAAITGALPQLGRDAQVGQHDTIANKLQSFITPAPIAGADVAQQNPGAPKEVADRQAQVMADANMKGSEYAARLADMSAYNLLNFNNGTMLNRTGEKVGNLNSAQFNSSQILPFELEAANRAGAKDMLYADLAGGAGSIAGMYAASGGGKGPTTVPGDMGGGTGITPRQYSPAFPGNGSGLRVGTPSPGLRFSI